MQHLVTATRAAVEQRNWYAALTLALTLPDVCAKLEDRIRPVGDRYKDWCRRYLEPVFTLSIGAAREPHVFLPAADAYGLRNAVLHEGRDDRDLRDGRILERYDFIEPHPGILRHLNAVGTRLELQVDLFCEEICVAVDQWLRDVQGDDAIHQRMTEMMRMRSPFD